MLRHHFQEVLNCLDNRELLEVFTKRKSVDRPIVRKIITRTLATPSELTQPSVSVITSGFSQKSSPNRSMQGKKSGQAASSRPSLTAGDQKKQMSSTTTGVRAPNSGRPSSKQSGKSAVARDDLETCKYCNRRFASDRLQVHEDICARTGKKKRKTYDATKHRLQGTDLEPYVKRGTKTPSSKNPNAMDAAVGTNRKNPNAAEAVVGSNKKTAIVAESSSTGHSQGGDFRHRTSTTTRYRAFVEVKDSPRSLGVGKVRICKRCDGEVVDDCPWRSQGRVFRRKDSDDDEDSNEEDKNAHWGHRRWLRAKYSPAVSQDKGFGLVKGEQRPSAGRSSRYQTPAPQVSNKSGTGPKKSDWRRMHEEFIAAIRAAKQAQAHIAKGGKLSELPPPPPSSNPDYVQCPHCGRRFNEAAAERHIPKCASYEFNKPKTNKAFSQPVKSQKPQGRGPYGAFR